MKKKPSEPLIIGGKKYYKYKIIWEDIVGDSTLATANDFAKMTCADVHTECWIFDKTDDYVYSFASYFTDDGEIEFGDRNIYPRSVIKSMKRI
tara:strand:- start:1432 stop:1710 length:279 start_codon:yes stop_codon:yes gene_type:complete